MPDSATPFPTLFSPIRIGEVELRNRIVLGGHGTRFVDWHNHHVAERQAHYFADRAKGGVAAIIQGSAMVHPTGLATGGVNEIWSDASIPSYRMLADAVHEHGTRMIGQLSHLGRQGHTFGAQRELWAPSAIPDPASRIVPHAMTRQEILELIDSYRSASARFLAAEFDGIEVYLAHGYLLCEFLSRFSNNREDAYGGSLENRIRLPLEVLRAVRIEVGPQVPIGIRVSADEFSPDGLHVGETVQIVQRLLDGVKIDYISVTQSNYASIETMIPDMSFPRIPFVHFAATIRKAVPGVPVLTVARIVTPEACEALLTDGTADAVCLVRPLIADPEFPNKAREGRREQIRECISCNVGCRGGPHRGMPIACLVNPAVGHERDWGIGKLATADTRRRVLVVGGGPGGLKAAETAALRGHEVSLLEAQDRLGGQVLTAAAAMPYRDEFANSVRHLESEIRRLGVHIKCGCTVDARMVVDMAPDVVVVATGSIPTRPSLPGSGADQVITAHDAIQHGVKGKRVVLLDSGEADWRCLTTAEGLAADGHAVTLVTPVSIGTEIDAFSRPPLLRRLRRGGVRFVEYHTASAIHHDRVTVREGLTGGEHDIPADAVVAAWFGKARDGLLHELMELGIDARAVGDCLAPRRAIDAIWDGFRIGREI